MSLDKYPYQNKVILSYGHNGFGNQLWQHSVAYMIARHMKARFLIATIPDEMAPGGVLPPNTWEVKNLEKRRIFLCHN